MTSLFDQPEPSTNALRVSLMTHVFTKGIHIGAMAGTVFGFYDLVYTKKPRKLSLDFLQTIGKNSGRWVLVGIGATGLLGCWKMFGGEGIDRDGLKGKKESLMPLMMILFLKIFFVTWELDRVYRLSQNKDQARQVEFGLYGAGLGLVAVSPFLRSRSTRPFGWAFTLLGGAAIGMTAGCWLHIQTRSKDWEEGRERGGFTF